MVSPSHCSSSLFCVCSCLLRVETKQMMMMMMMAGWPPTLVRKWSIVLDPGSSKHRFAKIEKGTSVANPDERGRIRFRNGLRTERNANHDWRTFLAKWLDRVGRTTGRSFGRFAALATAFTWCRLRPTTASAPNYRLVYVALHMLHTHR